LACQHKFFVNNPLEDGKENDEHAFDLLFTSLTFLGLP
jgi:hypothetical protein